MTEATRSRLEDSYRQNRAYVLSVIARRSPFIGKPDREAVYHDAFALVLEKASSGRLDIEAMSARQLRAYLAKSALLIALDQVRWGERAHTRPLTDDDLERPDGREVPAERIAEQSEQAVVREIVAELPARRQAIVKLRYFFDRDPQEVQDLLGISQRTYRLEIERAMRHIAARYQVARDGRWCEERRSLILAYVAGIAGPGKEAEARMHLHACGGCARMAAELREAARRVAAVAPLPELALHHGIFARGAEVITVVRDQLSGITVAAKQHATAVATRADPSASNYLTGARPGAVAAAVAGCIALGGGAASYCAVRGVPEALKPVFGLGQQTRGGRPQSGQAQSDLPAKRVLAPVRPIAESGQDAPALIEPAAAAPPPAPHPEPAPIQATREFGPERSAHPASTGGASDGGEFASPSSSSPAPPPRSGVGEFGP